MIRAFRRSRLVLVTAAVALLSTTPMTTLPLQHGGDDLACEPRLTRQGVPDLQLDAERGAAPDAEHCIICHWSRWARAIQHDAPAAATWDDCGPLVAAQAADPRSTATALAARAPPLS